MRACARHLRSQTAPARRACPSLERGESTAALHPRRGLLSRIRTAYPMMRWFADPARSGVSFCRSMPAAICVEHSDSLTRGRPQPARGEIVCLVSGTFPSRRSTFDVDAQSGASRHRALRLRVLAADDAALPDERCLPRYAGGLSCAHRSSSAARACTADWPDDRRPPVHRDVISRGGASTPLQRSAAKPRSRPLAARTSHQRRRAVPLPRLCRQRPPLPGASSRATHALS